MSGTDGQAHTGRFEALIPFLSAVAAVAVGSLLSVTTGSRLVSQLVYISTYILATAAIGAFLGARSVRNMRSYFVGVAILFSVISGPFLLVSAGDSGPSFIGRLAETAMRSVASG